MKSLRVFALLLVISLQAAWCKSDKLVPALEACRAAAREIRLDSLQPEIDARFQDSLDFLESAGGADRWTLASHELGKTSAADKVEKRKNLDSALGFVKKVTNGFIRRHLDSARQEIVLKPLNDFQAEEMEAALAERMNNLERLEIKYGPNSAKLNLAEIAINHFLLRSVPAFGVDEQGRPGPLEIVLAYTFSYVTPSWTNKNGTGVILTSAAEGGLRIYFLKHGWGRNALFPAYMTVGALMASKEQGVLRNPFEETPDWGGFVSWGAVKAGVVFADEPRFLLNRQFQFVPFFF